MKIISATEMQKIEQQAYKEGAFEELFMDKAGLEVANVVLDYQKENHLGNKVLLLCGKGNNAGDAFVCGLNLLANHLEVAACHFTPFEKCSSLCQKKGKAFKKRGGKFFENFSPKLFNEYDILIDGLFGTGFKGEIDSTYAEVIRLANCCKKPIIAIDIPSGINGDTGKQGRIAIDATITVFLGLPKKGCFLGDAWNHIGKFVIKNFGLKEAHINQAKADFILINQEIAQNALPKIVKNRHKYQAGYVVGLAGSKSMPGAAILSSYAALRAGAGIVRLLHPEEASASLVNAPIELIRQSFQTNDEDLVLETLNKAAAIFIGPGIGKSDQTKKLIENILPLIQPSCVIDADALNIISELNCSIPKNAILTPHHGEMQRLLQNKNEKLSIEELLIQTQNFTEDYQVTLVLKGSPTFIFHPSSIPLINTRGCSGMATAGTGDVLTGVISALLAQKLLPQKAAFLAVYLHAIAGEVAEKKKNSFGMIASDLLESLPEAYNELLLI